MVQLLEPMPQMRKVSATSNIIDCRAKGGNLSYRRMVVVQLLSCKSSPAHTPVAMRKALLEHKGVCLVADTVQQHGSQPAARRFERS